jgi:lysophospholipid acyltransferase (LPLAT)-like uncharacterized protein
MREAEPFEAYRPINAREVALRLLAPPLAHVVVHFASRLQGKRVHGLPHVRRALAEHGNAIFAFWHNRSFMGSFWWRWLLPRAPVCAMISRSLDGEILARVLRYIGADSVRGSEYDGGTAALKAAAGVLRDGVNLCITPDGPRGPLYAMKPGLVALARLSGKPIVPFAYDAQVAAQLVGRLHRAAAGRAHRVRLRRADRRGPRAHARAVGRPDPVAPDGCDAPCRGARARLGPRPGPLQPPRRAAQPPPRRAARVVTPGL